MILSIFLEVLRFLPNFVFVFRFDYLYNKFLIFYYLITVGRAGHGEWARVDQLASGVGWLTGGRRADGWSRRRRTGRGPDSFRAVHQRLTSGWHGREFFFICALFMLSKVSIIVYWELDLIYSSCFWPNCWFDFTRAAFFFLTWLWFVLIHVTDILNFFSGF